MSSDETLLWRDGALHSGPPTSDSALLVADSWLVTDGKVLAIALHRDRFVSAVQNTAAMNTAVTDTAVMDAGASDVGEFFDAALAAVPGVGDWFPRVELTAAGELVARIRSAPPRSRALTLITADSDPRVSPNVKGPSLMALERLRDDARAQGADEAVILSPDGDIVEGCTTALLWWRGEALCCPDRDLERVDSVTARTILALATALGIDILWEKTLPSELDGHELWAVNALHGIRIVTAWIGGPPLAEEPGRLSEWRARLEGLRRAAPTTRHD